MVGALGKARRCASHRHCSAAAWIAVQPVWGLAGLAASLVQLKQQAGGGPAGCCRRVTGGAAARRQGPRRTGSCQQLLCCRCRRLDKTCGQWLHAAAAAAAATYPSHDAAQESSAASSSGLSSGAAAPPQRRRHQLNAALLAGDSFSRYHCPQLRRRLQVQLTAAGRQLGGGCASGVAVPIWEPGHVQPAAASATVPQEGAQLPGWG